MYWLAQCAVALRTRNQKEEGAECTSWPLVCLPLTDASKSVGLSFRDFQHEEIANKLGRSGTTLLKYALDLCEKKNIDELYLHVQVNNTSAMAFYKEFGFEIIEKIPDYYKRIEPKECYVLQRTVKKGAQWWFSKTKIITKYLCENAIVIEII